MFVSRRARVQRHHLCDPPRLRHQIGQGGAVEHGEERVKRLPSTPFKPQAGDRGHVFVSRSKHSTSAIEPSVRRTTSPIRMRSGGRGERKPAVAPAGRVEVAEMLELVDDLHHVMT